MPKVLFCTACGGSYGMGHLKRCLSVIDEGKSYFESLVYIYKGDKESIRKRGELFGNYTFIRDPGEWEAFQIDLIVSDMRDTTKKDMHKLKRRAPVISIDDMGAGKDLSCVSINSLPLVGDFYSNYHGPEYIVIGNDIKHVTPLPFHKKEGVIVSFGGSDPSNLTGYITSILESLRIKPRIIRGPFYHHNMSGLKGEIIEAPVDLYDLINRAKVLITSFGITMYEAFFLKTPVVLFNHSKYHYELAKKIPVINLGYRCSIKSDSLKQKLMDAINHEELLAKRAQENALIIDGNGARRIVSVIEHTLYGMRKDCLFYHNNYRVLKRSEEFTLLQCRNCRDIFLYELKDKGPIYAKQNYFLEEYERKYGKSYINDKENIVALGLRRIGIIEKLKEGRGKLLDVGCAMGFFLELARERGWEVQGIEISGYASEWAKEHLSLNVKTASFLDADIKPESFDVVTLFFVVEHFQWVEKVIEKAYKILKKSGVIALALPNRCGISYRLSREGYLNSHARDHYFDTNVRNLKKFLKQHGFKRERIQITGIHPERFFNRIGIKRDYRLLSFIYKLIANLFKLGDTFEYYGIKK